MRKLKGDLAERKKDYFSSFSIKIEVMQKLVEFQILENQIRFLKQKSRWLTDGNKCNFS